MAVMTSPQLDGAILDQKLQAKMASDVEQKVNGVNGHPSPPSAKDIVPDEAESAATTPPPPSSATNPSEMASKNKDTEQAADTNSDALNSNRDPPEQQTAMDVDKPEDSQAPQNSTPKPVEDSTDAATQKQKVSPPGQDTVMNESSAPEAQLDASEVDGGKDPNGGSGDVEMKDVSESEPQAAGTQDPASGDHPEAASTQNTSVLSDVEGSPKAPEDIASPTGAEPTMHASPTEIKSPTKVSRDREEDGGVDEPPAKRARTESQHPVDSGAAVDTAQPIESGPMVNEPITVAAYVPSESAAPRDTWERYLIPDRENEPLTPTMVKEAKKAIAGIKKTKVGGQLCKPIEVTWPEVAEQYNQRIEKPMHFGAIDSKLKEDQYATLAELKSELDLIYSNAIEFNGLTHQITASVHGYVERVMDALKTASHDKPRPARKESTAKPPAHTRHHPKESGPNSTSRGATKHSRRESQVAPPAVASPPALPASKPEESPTFAPNPSGVPLIRRDSTKNEGKRPIHPPKNKDLDYSNKGQKKKLTPELKFYEEILKELQSPKHFAVNGPFLQPVDPVALNIPTYFNVIKKPMDLSTIATKLETGEYKKGKDFEGDMSLMFKNCFKFNPVGNVIHNLGKQFEGLYKELLSGKDAWMKDNAPPPAPPKGQRSDPTPQDSESEESEAEAGLSVEVSGDASLKKQQETVKLLDGRVKEESRKVSEEIQKEVPNESIINISQLLLSTLTKELLQEKKKLADMMSKSPAPKPAKATKAAKAKAGGAAPKKAAPGPRKPGPKKASSKKRGEAGAFQREVVTDGILDLDEANMNKCIEIIKKDTNQTENDDNELELDVSALSSDAVWKLFDIIKAKLPDVVEARRKAQQTERQTSMPQEASPPRQVAKAARPKKNKPMNKQEQERKIEQLKELKAKFQRSGSGSQEPLPSVEDLAQDESSDDDEPSDSEEE